MSCPFALPRVPVLAFVTLFIACTSLRAHEFWVDPVAHHVTADGDIVADLRVGQRYKGDAYSFVTQRFERFTIENSAGRRDYEGEQGDRPALSTPAGKAGLTVIAYHSRPSRLRYAKWEKFLTYTVNEGLEWAVAAHREAGLPETGFTERYSRCAKALVQVGPVNPEDRDRDQGMPLELIALDNPFVAGLETLAVRLLWGGAPAGDIQITIFRKKAEGTARRETLRTDADGLATIKLEPGRRHLLNAVRMERSATDGAEWESHWASLTFETPPRPGTVR